MNRGAGDGSRSDGQGMSRGVGARDKLMSEGQGSYRPGMSIV